MWRPSASISALQKRAGILAKIREFFANRQVLEVETPLLSHATVTDMFVPSITATFQPDRNAHAKELFLQTSPEYAMKRLLAAGSGCIYQITKAFRHEDSGKLHNPEFTMLEWYRLGFDHHALMDEMDELLQLILNTAAAERLSYAAVFEKFLQINPHNASMSDLKACAVQQNIHVSSELTDKDAWLDLLMSHCIEPRVGQERPLFLYDFPASQAALAKIRVEENPPVASRFEVYFKGVELANGFHELQHGGEQRGRFEAELRERVENSVPLVPIDERFLAALEAGLPECSGVALGIDRLVMLALGSCAIEDVVSFSFGKA